MEKVKGYTNEAVGAVKEGVGKAVGNEHLQAEGMVQKDAGKCQVAGEKAAGMVEAKTDQVTGAVKENFGKLTDDNSLKMEGKAERLKGDAKEVVNS